MPDEAQTRLMVLRGNSGSGKTSVAQRIRGIHGPGLAWVGQDVVRRTLLKEPDRPGAPNIGLLAQITRYSLDHGFHVVLEGILHSAHYGAMLLDLRRTYGERARFHYLDVSLEETLARHQGRPQSAEFDAADMRRWFCPDDLVPGLTERVIGQSSSLEETARGILADADLLETAP